MVRFVRLPIVAAVALTYALVGCDSGPKNPPRKFEDIKKEAHDHDHDHGHEGHDHDHDHDHKHEGTKPAGTAEAKPEVKPEPKSEVKEEPKDKAEAK